MRRRLRGFALILSAGLLLVAAPAVAEEPQLDDHGWWWRAQTGATDLPPPPFVPEDGLAVAREVDGPYATAAIRYRVGDAEVTAATLTLEVANEQGGDVAAIRACPAGQSWSGASAGTWDERPEADCDAGEVAGQRDEENELWEFEVGLLAEDGMVDLVLLPAEEADDAGDGDQDPFSGTAPDGRAGAPFQVAFEPPQEDSLETSGGLSGDFDGGFEDDDFGDDGEDTGDDDAAGDSAGAGTSPERSDPVALDTSEANGSAGGSDGPSEARAPDVADSADPDAEQVTDEPPGDSAQPAPEVANGSDDGVAVAPVGFGDDRGRQLAALVSLLAVAAAAFLFLSERGMATGGIPGLRSSRIVDAEVARQRLPAGIAGGEGERLGGLGRFVRPREGEPHSL